MPDRSENVVIQVYCGGDAESGDQTENDGFCDIQYLKRVEAPHQPFPAEAVIFECGYKSVVMDEFDPDKLRKE